MNIKFEKLLGDIPVHWPTFLDIPPSESDPDDCQVWIVPIPYDLTTSYKSGARHGPSVIVEASRHLEDYDHELGRDVSKVGIATLPFLQPSVNSVEDSLLIWRKVIGMALEKGKFPLVLGGDHSLSIGSGEAVADFYPEATILYIDAHADMRDSFMGSKFSHACSARRIWEKSNIVLAGIRSLSEEENEFISDNAVPMYTIDERGFFSDKTITNIIERLGSNVYLSIDLDVFDPSVISDVGTPEPGGLLWEGMLHLLKAVAKNSSIIGADIVELSPISPTVTSGYTAAKLAYKLIGYATEFND